jgi:peptidoglycan/LPS O-acetylase OafA/YrhL
MTAESQPVQINTLQALRGISALLVVGYHWQTFLNNVYAKQDLGSFIFKNGFIGVDIFFVISGFVMVFITQQPATQRVMPFLIKRMCRIIPLMWLALMIQHLINGASISSLIYDKPMLQNMFFILPGGDPPQYGKGFIDIMWTLSYEIVFYMIFALSMKLSGKFRSVLATCLLILMVSGLQIEYSGHITFHTELAPQYHGFLWPQSMLSLMANPYFLEFIPGMLLAEIYLRMPKWHFWWIHFIAATGVMIFIWAFLGHFSTDNRLQTCLPWALLLTASVLLWEKLGRIRMPKILLALGNITFGMYLLHLPLAQLIEISNWGKSITSLTGFPKMFTYLLIVISVSAILHVLVERPFIKLGHKSVQKIAS